MNTYRLPPALSCTASLPVLTSCRGGFPVSFSSVVFTSSYPATTGEHPVHPYWGDQYDNYYAKTETTTSTNPCTPVRGWYGVLGGKTWHGCFGYEVEDYCNDCYLFDTGSGYPYHYECCLEPVHNSPPDTKYLTVTVMAKGFTFDYTNPDFNDLQDISEVTASVSVDRYSGKATATFNQSFTTGSGGYSYEGSASLWGVILNRAKQLLQATCVAQYAPGEPDQCNDDGNIWNWDGAWLPCCGLCNDWFGGAATSFSDSGASSQLHYTITPPTSYSIDVTVTFSDAYTTSDVNGDAGGVGGIFLFRELTPDMWRTDTDFALVPYCHWDESPYATNPIPIMLSLLDSGSYTDTSTFTGAGLGYILPSQYTSGSGETFSASYGPYYQSKHLNWSYDDDGHFWTLTGSGSWCPSSLKRATEWTPDYLRSPNSAMGMKGALKKFSPSGIGDDMLFVRKYAEILLNNRPSHNWSRPYLELDANEKNQLSRDCSAGSNADLYYSGSQFTAYLSGSVHAFNNPSGSLRWTGLSSITSSATMSFYNDEKKKQEFTLVEWTYDRGYREMTRYIAGLPASGTLCAPYFPTMSNTRTGAQDLATVEANTYNIRFDPCKINFIMVIDQADVQEQNDYFFLPAMYKTNFGTEYWMPAIATDKRYGSKLYADIVPIMTNPLWQAPASPCVLTGSVVYGQTDGDGTALQYWNEADGRVIYEYGEAVAGGGMCNNDEVTPASRLYRWYPFRPLVECITAPPADACTGIAAPALPSGSRALNDCSNYTTLWNASPSDVPRLQPYQYCEFCVEPAVYVDTYGYGSYYQYNWKITELQESCILSDGRFAEIYAKNLGYNNVPTVLL